MKYYNLFIFAFLIVNLVLAQKSNENQDSGFSEYELKHIKTLEKYTSECAVLLRKNGDFPLNKSVKDIFLYGNGVRKTIKGGTGSGDVNSHKFETIEEAFTNNGFNILTKDYLDKYDEIYDNAKLEFKKKLHSDPANIANPFSLMGVVMPEPEYEISYEKSGDVAIYVLGRISGEGGDRNAVKGDIYLTDTEKKIILDLAKGFKKFLLVLNTGGPVDLSGLESVKNILLLSQLGVNTSKTLVDIVVGEKYPSGKLATTWTKLEDYQTIGDFGDIDDTNYKEGIYVGYRYFDSANVDVMFPFGFGLGYTEFKINLKSAKLAGEKFEVTVSVQNIGKYKGKEVVELYLSKPNTTLDEPYQILVGFAKTKELKPKEKVNIKVNFKLSDFPSYDTKTATYIIDKGEYVVRVGNSSRNTQPCGIISVDKKIDVKKVQNKLGKPDFEDYVPKAERKNEDLRKVHKFIFRSKILKTKVASYNKKFDIPAEVKAMTDEQKVTLVVGAYADPDAPTTVIGSASISAPGAAGETASFGGLKPIIMADGPSGVRIAKNYFVDENGLPQSLEGSMPASMIEFFPDDVKAYFESMTKKAPEGAEILHQYTTAIPIGTALAQSWNKEFAEICGDIVGTEMEMYKINLWLAPALNIHRSVLCGRNFEYYSEDPFITGVFASTVTAAHYAANNQETNRYLSSSNISERALREIYLKGFEMTIKESNPGAIMTSFNLINGVHANESKDLVKDILRNEFDFNGIVMTDWLGDYGKSKYENPVQYKIIKASGDVCMPGTKADYENIMTALKEGNLTMQELEESASRIYTFSKKIEN
ncbi:glycoside hydrolase family 3 protein [Piromyces sp. E2]|nr:glycoside hydrolase family 3 protein [Piromyces sp. E2]|eukprot:OUM62468.1 glycoside hydrolase family 3 protein [Piromyces sp. E2]